MPTTRVCLTVTCAVHRYICVYPIGLLPPTCIYTFTFASLIARKISRHTTECYIFAKVRPNNQSA